MLPSHESRVEKGYEVFMNYNLNINNSRIILTGGDTKQFNITEASIMKRKWISLNNDTNILNNVDNLILLDEKSTNTVENALNCYNIINTYNNNNNENYTIDIITNEFHVPRTKCIFNCVFNNSNNNLCYYYADSRLKKSGRYRLIENRDINEHPDIHWLLCERLDFEFNAVYSLNEYLSKYNLYCKNEDIENALIELRKLNETYNIL